MAAEDSRPEAETHPAAVVADNQAEADRRHRTAAEPDSLASVAGSYRPGLVAVGSIPAVDKAECWAGRDTLHMDCIHLAWECMDCRASACWAEWDREEVRAHRHKGLVRQPRQLLLPHRPQLVLLVQLGHCC